MKRILCLLFALLMVLLCACNSGEQPTPSPSASTAPTPTPSVSQPVSPPPSETPEPSEEPSPSPTPSEEPPVVVTYTNPLTGMPMEEDTANQKPVAIMLNNIKAAMPQQGNSQADIIYEVLAEGGYTLPFGQKWELEVGAAGNSPEEAALAAQLFAENMAALLLEK